MKKILFILHYPPPVHGAAMVGKYIMDSAIINNNFHCSYVNLGTSQNVDEIGKSGIKKWFRYFNLLANTLKKIVVFKPDVVYFTLTSNGMGFYKDALVVLLTKILGKKTIYHFHNKGVKDYQHKFLDNILYKLVFNNSKVILLSPNLYSDVAKYVSIENTYFCPNGIPDINPVISHSSSSLKKNTRILFLSNLILLKGIYVLLDACKILKEKSILFDCTIIGGEGNITATDLNVKIRENGLKEMVNYKGKKYGKEKEQAFKDADIFVFPTCNETFGLVNLEAMQFSLPVVSTFEGGIPDVVEDGKTGFLVEKGDALALANKIEVLLKNPELRAVMGKKGRLVYETNFTLPIFEKRMCEILKRSV